MYAELKNHAMYQCDLKLKILEKGLWLGLLLHTSSWGKIGNCLKIWMEQRGQCLILDYIALSLKSLSKFFLNLLPVQVSRCNNMCGQAVPSIQGEYFQVVSSYSFDFTLLKQSKIVAPVLSSSWYSDYAFSLHQPMDQLVQHNYVSPFSAIGHTW